MAADFTSRNGKSRSPGLLRFLRRISVVLLLVAQFAVSIHFADHLADGDGHAAACTVCVVAAAGATPTPEIAIAAPDVVVLERLFAHTDSVSDPEGPIHFHPRGPPHAHTI